MSGDGQRTYRVLVSVDGGNGGTHECETSADDALAAVTYVARFLHQVDPHARIERIHVGPVTGDE